MPSNTLPFALSRVRLTTCAPFATCSGSQGGLRRGPPPAAGADTLRQLDVAPHLYRNAPLWLTVARPGSVARVLRADLGFACPSRAAYFFRLLQPHWSITRAVRP